MGTKIKETNLGVIDANPYKTVSLKKDLSKVKCCVLGSKLLEFTYKRTFFRVSCFRKQCETDEKTKYCHFLDAERFAV